MAFKPSTTVFFLRTGIDENNKVKFDTQQEMYTTFNSNRFLLGTMANCSFQRADGYNTVRVDHSEVPYYRLMKCDTLMYLNLDTEDAFYIVANIIGVEWKNPDCSFVRFKIDYFMTYQTMIDWSRTYAYIERQHVKDDWSPSDNPLFSNMGPAESFGTVADVPFYIWTQEYNLSNVLVMSPYDESGEAVFDGSMRGGLYSALQNDVLSADAANQRFQSIAEKKTASINNIVGVMGVPGEIEDVFTTGGEHKFVDKVIPAVNVAAGDLPSMIKYNNAKCWSAPFVNIRLMSSTGQVVDITPQWLGNDQSQYTVKQRAGGAGGMFGGLQMTLLNKNGAFDWNGWNDFIVSIQELPSCPWTGDGFTDWARRNLGAQVASGVNSVVSDVVGASQGVINAVDQDSHVGAAIGTVGSIVQGITSATSTLANIAASINNQRAAGSTVKGVGSYQSLMDIAANKWGFKIVYYSTQIYTMRAVDAYFDRFGYRLNQIKKLELETRPYWTFIKTLECHVVPGQGLSFIAERAINAMFNRGVTMWTKEKYVAGRNIGDFSNPQENKGVQS